MSDTIHACGCPAATNMYQHDVNSKTDSSCAPNGGEAVAVPTGTWNAHMIMLNSRGTSGVQFTTPAP